MEEQLNKILEQHELNLLKYSQEREARGYKINFMLEHSFKHEANALQVKQDATTDMFLDYRKSIKDLRGLLNDWNS